MSRNKLERFKLNAERRNVIEPGKELYNTIKGKWREFFGNSNDLVLEVGCGRGEYTTGLALLYPNRNFIGIDLKGARLWKGSTVALENGYDNAAFLRIQMQFLEAFFEEGEANEIWITFPDPRPKDKEEKLRLTSPNYLQIYKKLMGKHGKINFKTDNRLLFEYTLSVVKELNIRNLEYTFDLYNSPMLAEHYGIQTTYERKFMQKGSKINYLRFEFAD